MSALFSALAVKAWALIVPWAGPLLWRAWPVIAYLRALPIVRWVRAATYFATLAAGMWLGAQALSWWQGDLISEREAKARAAAALAEATLKAREDALKAREAHLKSREQQLEADALEIAKLENELQEARHASALGDGTAVLRADDEWLRAWIGRR